MKRYLTLLTQFANYSIKAEMEFRLNTFIYFAFSFFWVFTTYVALILVYNQAGKVAGWSREEAILLTLVYYVTSSIVRNFVNPSITELVEKIRKGELDFVLSKPVDSQFFVSLQKMRILTSLRGIILMGVLAYYISHLQLSVSLSTAIAASVLALFGIVGLYAFYFFIATLTIWLENIWNIEEIFMNALAMSKQPMEIYPQVIRGLVIHIIPVVGISAIPTLVLLHRLELSLALSFIISTIVLFYFSRKFFYFALSRYTSASS